MLPADTVPCARSINWPSTTKSSICYPIDALLAFPLAIHERRRYLPVLLITMSAMDVLLEFGQLYSPGRSFDVNDILTDMLADAVGVVIGALARLSFRQLIPAVVWSSPCSHGKALPRMGQVFDAMCTAVRAPRAAAQSGVGPSFSKRGSNEKLTGSDKSRVQNPGDSGFSSNVRFDRDDDRGNLKLHIARTRFANTSKLLAKWSVSRN
jgi:VanZ like family